MNNDYKMKLLSLNKKFCQSGLENFSDTEILELALSFSMTKNNNNLIAQRLIESCGSISSVIDTPYSVLKEYGVSESAAVMLKMIPEITQIYLNEKLSKSEKVNLYNSRIEKISYAFIGSKTEKVLLMLTNKNNQELYSEIISSGSLTFSGINIRQIIDLALRYNAANAYIAHNHPSGIAYPSEKDIAITIKIKNALSTVGVTLKDHYIISDTKYFSMSKSDNFCDIFLYS